jgi:hypothetical protein
MKSIFSGILDENNYDTLCLELTEAESEQDVIGILNNYGLWDDDSYWTDYGHDENNVAIIGNQTSNPEAALVEKFTNSIDAILIKEAKLRGIDPKGKTAPQSIDEAMNLFYGVKDKNIKHTSEETFEKLKQQIYFVATGSERRPSLAIIDKGEGQTPNMLPETILSLRKTNKLEIKFVQGQFNQGGTAVLPFCGTHRLQLVISKRNQQIADTNDESHHKWGFTIVRRNTNDVDSRNTRYEYLVIDDKIPAFEKDYLNLLPSTYPHARAKKLTSGTYIKLFEYNIGIQSHINLSLNYNLSLRLPGAKIPIGVYERRKWNTKQISMRSYLYGHFYRFMNAPKQLEKGFPYTYTMEVDTQTLEIMIVCLKKDKKRSYKSNEGILFTLNGQTQGIMPDSFFDRKAVGLGYLKESLMVFVDASKLDVKYREDLFMSNREALRNIPFKRKIEKLLEVELNRNKTLQKLQTARRNEMIKERANSSDAMKKTMSKLIKHSPSLNVLFNTGYDFNDPSNQGTKGEENLFSFEGKKYPSYFDITTPYTINTPKHCPINRTFRVTFKTDVEDLYFMRHKDKGVYTFEIENHILKDYSLSLKHGKASFTCILPDDVSVNEILHFNYKISNRNAKIKTFLGDFYVQIDEVAKKDDTLPTDKDKKDKKPKSDNLNLPPIHEVYKNEWNTYDFNEEDAIKIIQNQTGHDFFINMDNKYLNIERKNAKNDALRLNEIFKGSIFLYALSMLENKTYEENLNEISTSAKAFARVSIPIINYGDTYKE